MINLYYYYYYYHFVSFCATDILSNLFEFALKRSHQPCSRKGEKRFPFLISYMNFFNPDCVCKPHIGKIRKKFDEHERLLPIPN